jgi:putative ABC transport system substrate-binding protein
MASAHSSLHRRRILRHSIAFIGVGLAAAIPLAAQPSRRKFRIGILLYGEPDQPQPYLPVFVAALARRGLVEGDALTIDRRYIRSFDGQQDTLAAELAALKPDVIFTTCGFRCARAAQRRAAATVPVVFDGAGNPVGQGLTNSLSKPSANMTGSSVLGGELDMKRFELLTEALGASSMFAMLQAPLPEQTRSIYRSRLATFEEAHKIRIVLIEVADASELEPAFGRMARDGVEALVVASSPIAIVNAREIAALCTKYRLPAIGEGRGFVDAGLLMTYTMDFAELYERGAEYVYRILLGATPAELPIVQPTRFEMVVNLATAKSLGVQIPRALLMRANRVIE